MSRPEREVVERLGPSGLARVLTDLLDHPHLVRLANACELRYPGMRTQSQKRERILADLADRAVQDEAARKAVFRALRKETAASARMWAALDEGERARRLQDDAFLSRNGNLGRHLFLLASSPSHPAVDEALGQLLAREKGSASEPRPAAPAAPDPAALTREVARLGKKALELQKKVAYQEGQIAKSRETEKALKRDVIQRKGELAESRMLAERLRRELQDARGAASEAAAAQANPGQPGPQIEELASAVRKLGSEQRRLVHRLEKIAEVPSPAPIPPDLFVPVLRAIEEVQKETAGLKRERKKDLQEQAKRLEDLQAEVRSLREAARAALPSPKTAMRRKGEPDRVGVFIDVQNMYYAARQLRGKLDFDALLQAAVRDRRLIQATAYVVETKEIDQSGFIAVLQQRGIEVRRKTLRVRSDGSMKGDWDMEMALDILDAAPKLDVVVLVSGDGDFTSLVNRVKAIGPRIEVIGFPRNTAKSLLEAADHFQPLDRKFVIRADERPPSAARRERGSIDAGGDEKEPTGDLPSSSSPAPEESIAPMAESAAPRSK